VTRVLVGAGLADAVDEQRGDEPTDDADVIEVGAERDGHSQARGLDLSNSSCP